MQNETHHNFFILSTKLNRPPGDDKWVQRSRLISHLDNGMNKRKGDRAIITLMSYPDKPLQ